MKIQRTSLADIRTLAQPIFSYNFDVVMQGLDESLLQEMKICCLSVEWDIVTNDVKLEFLLTESSIHKLTVLRDQLRKASDVDVYIYGEDGTKIIKTVRFERLRVKHLNIRMDGASSKGAQLALIGDCIEITEQEQSD